MKEQLITFETAKLAKQKGFEFLVEPYPRTELMFDGVGQTIIGSNANIVHPSFYLKPTQSLLQKWLREKHNIIVTSDCAIEGEWWYQLKHSPTEMIRIYKSTGLLGDSKTYEEALEKGLIEALKLIKNKKNEKI